MTITNRNGYLKIARVERNEVFANNALAIGPLSRYSKNQIQSKLVQISYKVDCDNHLNEKENMASYVFYEL